jgi:uncharacterized protein YecT (DUF1311 family)
MAATLAAVLLAALATLAPAASAGALAECQTPNRDFEAVARCLTALDLETLAALQDAEKRAAAAARELDEKTKRGNAAYAAFMQSTRAFALFQGAECEYVHTMTPGANIRSKSAGPSPADLARIACRIELARSRIDMLKP